MSVFGTPAEESSGGKIDLIKANALQDINATLMAHPFPFNLPKPLKFGLSLYVLVVVQFSFIWHPIFLFYKWKAGGCLCGNSNFF